MEFLEHVPYVQFDESGVVLCASHAGSTALQAISGGESGVSSELHRAARGLGSSAFGVTELLPRDGSLASYYGLIWRTTPEGVPRYVALLLHGDLFSADELGWSRVFSRSS